MSRRSYNYCLKHVIEMWSVSNVIELGRLVHRASGVKILTT